MDTQDTTISQEETESQHYDAEEYQVYEVLDNGYLEEVVNDGSAQDSISVSDTPTGPSPTKNKKHSINTDTEQLNKVMIDYFKTKSNPTTIANDKASDKQFF